MSSQNNPKATESCTKQLQRKGTDKAKQLKSDKHVISHCAHANPAIQECSIGDTPPTVQCHVFIILPFDVLLLNYDITYMKPGGKTEMIVCKLT